MRESRIFCTFGVDPSLVPRLDGETVVLVPNTAVVDVNVAACHIEALVL